jgi:glyoxylase-like metal-dependent hydrolase (beta-lactamase superfamily II)
MRQRLLCFVILLGAAGLAPAQEQDLSKVEIKTTQLAPGVFLLQGAGGNITAAIGTEGALLVDDSFAALADKIRAALTAAAGANVPVRYVINTHYHYDHTGGNLAFIQGGATVFAHDNLRPRLASGGTAGNGAGISREIKPVDPQALPQVTFDHEISVHVSADDALVVHYANAHTDGDAIVYFPRTHLVAMGDIYVRYGFPFIDLNSGGSVQGMIAACQDVLRRAPADAKIVPGHGELGTIADLREYAQMLTDTSAAVTRALKANKTLAQMKQEKLLGAWSERYSPPKAFVDTDAFIDTLYNSLHARRARHGPQPR